jgi:hypothetical protein
VKNDAGGGHVLFFFSDTVFISLLFDTNCSFHCEPESLLCPVSEVRVYDVQSAHVSRRGQTFCMCGQPTMM